MSYITKNRNAMYKDERNQITLNKDLFAFASDFNDEYFANDLNWKKVAIHFKHTTSNQKKIIVLMQESQTGWFEVSEMGRTGTWEIEQIQIFDKDGGMESIARTGMPTPANFDISTERKISPSEIVASVNGSGDQLTLTDVSNYEIGFKVKAWDETLLTYLSSTVYTISAINGLVITLDAPLVGHAGKTLRLKFANFADCSPRQKGIYQFVGVTF